MEHLELLLCLPAAVIGLLVGLRLPRQQEEQSDVTPSPKPTPKCVDGGAHSWHDTPYVKDASKPEYRYACLRPGCRIVLKKRALRRLS